MNKQQGVAEGNRYCYRCKRELPLTTEHFYKDKSRLGGLSYDCRLCLRERKKGRDRRRGRYSLMSPKQRAMTLERQRRYNRTNNGRALKLRLAYKQIDSCDLSTDEVAEIIALPCTYCCTVDANRGLDRIDNSAGHVRGNVLPACAACNLARGDRFTVDEMKVIGQAVAQVRRARSDSHRTKI
jgi:hypothetical protein